MFLELCTGLSVPKLSGIPKNSQHPSNSLFYIEFTSDNSDDSDKSESEYSHETVGGLSTPTEVNFEYIKKYLNINSLNVYCLHDYSARNPKSPNQRKLMPMNQVKLASPRKNRPN